jgi:enoyl-CoA hydratase/carnithine racemase
MITADEALAAGLLRELHSADAVLSAAVAYARRLVEHTSPVSVALTRRMMWRHVGLDHPITAHLVDSRFVKARASSADAREGVASFLEKRDPRFCDRISDGVFDPPEWPSVGLSET